MAKTITPGEYVLDYAGMGRYLRRSAPLQRALLKRAEQGVAMAQALAPTESGEYRANIRAEAARGWDGRQAARIVAHAPYSAQVEWGRRGGYRPYAGRLVLTRVARALNTSHRGRRI